MLYFFYLFLLYFTSNIIVVQNQDYNDQLRKVLSDDDVKQKNRYDNEDFTYDSNGFLKLNGKWKNIKAKPSILFFKQTSETKCTEDAYNGIFFDMFVCIPCGSSCKNGMKICYEPEMTSDMVKNPEKHALKKVNSKVRCKNDKLHGLQINAEFNVSSKLIDITIISSIDENRYKFTMPLPPEDIQTSTCCFKIRVGTDKNLATQITDLNDVKLNVTPPLKTIAEGRAWMDDGWANSKSNLHLLSLDFIPMKDKRLSDVGDFYKKFSYFGGGENCPMYIKIAGDFVLTCKRTWELFDKKLICNHHNNTQSPKKRALSYKSGNGNMIICRLIVTDTMLTKIGDLERSTDTTGSWNTSESYLKYKSYDIKNPLMDIDIPGDPGFGKIVKKVLPDELVKLMDWTKKIEHDKSENTNENIIESSLMQTTTITTSYDLKVRVGEYMEVQVLKYDCNGWIFTTNYLRTFFDDKPKDN